MSAELDDRFLSLADLCAYSGLSRATLERAMADVQDPLPSYTVTRRVLVRRSEFDAWMLRRRRGPQTSELELRTARRMLAAVRRPRAPGIPGASINNRPA